MPRISELGNITNLLVGLLLLTGAMDFQAVSLGTTGIRNITIIPSP